MAGIWWPPGKNALGDFGGGVNKTETDPRPLKMACEQCGKLTSLQLAPDGRKYCKICTQAWGMAWQGQRNVMLDLPAAKAKPKVPAKVSGSSDRAIGDRATLMCASPGCTFLVHERVELGGYCCLACAEGGPHGPRCQRITAPRGLKKADPAWLPMDGATLMNWDDWRVESSKKEPVGVTVPEGLSREEAEMQQAMRLSMLEAAKSGDTNEFDMPDDDSDGFDMEDWGSGSGDGEYADDPAITSSNIEESGPEQVAKETEVDGANIDEIVVSWKNVRLTRGDIALFQEGRWLNDACIDFFFEHLLLKHHDLSDRVLLLGATSAFWLVNEDDPEELEQAASSLHLGEKSLVLCAVNDHADVATTGGTHWSLLVLRRSPGTDQPLVLEHFDSMSLNSTSAGRYAQRLTELCRLAVHSASPAELVSKSEHVLETSAAKQRNSCDCGVYVLLFAEAVLEAFILGDEADVINIKPEDALQKRREALVLVEQAAKPGVNLR